MGKGGKGTTKTKGFGGFCLPVEELYHQKMNSNQLSIADGDSMISN